MKKIFILSSLFLVLIIIGCSSDPVGLDTNKDSGKILLKIDKQNAPESVVFVKAYLTRENHQPITGTLNLQSDSTADILLENIDAGEWHLKVDAEDDSGLVLYTGETEVQIFAGFTSQVYLTLNPTGSGTGSIYINVTWGVPGNFNWIQQNSGTNLQLRDVFFINENLGWVVGSQGKVLKTTDGGNSWQNISINTSVSLNSVWFVSSEIGFIAGSNGLAFKTIDGGTTWNSFNLGYNIILNEIQFTQSEIGFITGDDGLIFKTTNMGTSWSVQYINSYASLFGLKILTSLLNFELYF